MHTTGKNTRLAGSSLAVLQHRTCSATRRNRCDRLAVFARAGLSERGFLFGWGSAGLMLALGNNGEEESEFGSNNGY